MRLFTKEELINELRDIFSLGFHESVKKTGNDGAVGNTLESLLGIKENNLPMPNASEWELKGQREKTNSLITLKHIELSPKAAKIVSSILLPLYGWTHQKAGTKYPANEMSFRSTTSSVNFSSRGFRIFVDTIEQKVKFVFDATKVDRLQPAIKAWLDSVEKRVGLQSLNPEPYWGFQDLEHEIGTKIKNCFYVVAESKKESGKEFFKYKHLYLLSGFSFDKFLDCINDGTVLIDFDARTGHNHGTKFRIRQNSWCKVYKIVDKVI
jgi:hypothetical protein